MGRRSRMKGADFERGMAKVMRSVWPEARRGIGQARCASEVPDVDGTPFWVETKHRKRVSILAAFEQAAEATDGRPVVAVTRENNRPILVTMALADWLELVDRARNGDQRAVPALVPEGVP